jgi:hypothetical protein
MTNEVYLKSKKRLVLAIALSVLVCYTLVGSFPDENKILALALLPFCAMQLWDWIRRQK